MKIKTSELTYHALDWAVAKCLEPSDERLTVIRREDYIGHPIERETEKGSYTYEWWCPTRIWAQGGPIIEREEINLEIHEGGHTRASWYQMRTNFDGKAKSYGHAFGPTPLIAAMRCFVASKLGDEVDVPDELIKQHTQS